VIEKPGRQRRVAKNVAAIESSLDSLGARFYELMPQLYKDRAQNQKPLLPINAAWHEAMMSLCANQEAIAKLRQMLKERIQGMPLPPACQFVSQDQQMLINNDVRTGFDHST
jgi:hypothetical protein